MIRSGGRGARALMHVMLIAGFAFASSFFGAVADAAPPAAECERPARLRFSLVPQSDVQKELGALAPLFADVQAATGLPVEVVTPSSYGGVVEGLLAGALDFARLGPASYVAAKRGDPQLMPIATISRRTSSVDEDSAYYHSVLVVRSDSGYTVAALRGKKLALVDPDSTSGGLIPRGVFPAVVHAPLERYFGQIVYSGAHDQSVQALLKKQADAAFLSSTALAATVENKTVAADAVRIVWRSAPIPRDPFVLRGQLCGDVKSKIVSVFLANGGNANKPLMDNLKATRFVPIRDGDYDMVRHLSR